MRPQTARRGGLAFAPLLALLLLALAARSWAQATGSAPAAAEAAAERARTAALDAELIDGLVQRALSSPGGVAMSVAVARGSELVYERTHGPADLELGVAANERTLFRIGSITKQFTAAAILVLAERGKLSVDDPLTRFLPDYPTHGHEITLRHLLTHTAGVQNYTDMGPRWENVRTHALSDAEMVALWKDLPLEFAPGERWRYSNSGYYLLGLVIEKASGQSYADFLRTTLFEPLGLERTRYDSSHEIVPNRAQGYALGEDGLENDAYLDMRQPGAAGGLLSTAGELVRWQLALVQGRAVSKASYEEMTLPYILTSGRETSYGLGLQLDTQAGRPCVRHGGAINGFNSALLYFPGEQLSIATISSSELVRADALALSMAEGLLGR
jgi:CubicO group peptidase (beta-lactamase class C family)